MSFIDHFKVGDPQQRRMHGINPIHIYAHSIVTDMSFHKRCKEKKCTHPGGHLIDS